MVDPARARDSVVPTVLVTMAVLLAGAIALVVALATRPSGGLTVPRGERVVHVDERDFHIQLRAPTTLRAGNYVFVDDNHGPSAHELVMWKTADRVDKLPLLVDHRVDEESKDLDKVLDSGSSLHPGETRLLTVSLDPGHYVLVCNLPGHFVAGMHVDLTVR